MSNYSTKQVQLKLSKTSSTNKNPDWVIIPVRSSLDPVKFYDNGTAALIDLELINETQVKLIDILYDLGYLQGRFTLNGITYYGILQGHMKMMTHYEIRLMHIAWNKGAH